MDNISLLLSGLLLFLVICIFFLCRFYGHIFRILLDRFKQ